MRLDRQGAQSQYPKGYTPNFSAPEVIRRDSVSFSADIWSVMCCLIEMLTGYLPWCYKDSPTTSCITVQNIILLVGNYDEKKDFERLLPQELIEDIEISLDVIELFKSVFKRDSKNRPTALHLLENPLIKDAHEYEKLFDEYAYEEAITPTGATPTYETPVKKSSSTESHSSIDSGNYERSSSSNTSSPGSAGPQIDDSSKNNKFPMSSVIPDSTFRGLENQFADMNFTTPSYRPLSLTSSSAPSDMTGGCWEENGRGGGLFTGQDDDERDGTRQVMVRGTLKRTTSANYVSNGPEVDSPDGRHHHRSFPQASYVKNNSVFTSNVVTVGGGMVSVGTQTSLSPTIESTSLLGSQTTYVSSSFR